MAERFRFFNSQAGDIREYNASEFAEYFSLFLSNGVYTENGQAGLKVSAGSGMNISIATGYAFIDGYMYNNDSVLTKTIEPSDATLDRIDRVIIKFDEFNRKISIEIKKGSLASSPIPPSLVNTSTLKELSLAQVRVKKGAASILNTDILDERLSQYCGVVSSLIDIPIVEMWNVWNNSLSDIQQMWNEWYQNATSGIISAGMIQQDANNRLVTDSQVTNWNNKVDKANGKVLSTNDYSNTEKDKLAGIEEGAQKNVTPTKAAVGLGNVDNAKQMPIAGGTFTGVAKAQANTSYTTSQLRNTILSPSNPSGGANGDIWIKYS